MRPTETELESTHIVVRQGLQAIIADRRIDDDSSRRVEMIQIQAEEKAITRSGLVVETRGDHQVVALSCLSAEIGIQRVDYVRYLLEVDRIAGICKTSAVVSVPGTGNGPFGGGSVVPAGIPKLLLRNEARFAEFAVKA